MPMSKPIKVNNVLLFFLKKIISIITTNKGFKALMSAASPLETYFTLHVLKPFDNTNVKIESTNSHLNCCQVGNFSPRIKKKISSSEPAINCLIYEICNPGTCCTPILLATHVVPQIILVKVSAK